MNKKIKVKTFKWMISKTPKLMTVMVILMDKIMRVLKKKLVMK